MAYVSALHLSVCAEDYVVTSTALKDRQTCESMVNTAIALPVRAVKSATSYSLCRVALVGDCLSGKSAGARYRVSMLGSANIADELSCVFEGSR